MLRRKVRFALKRIVCAALVCKFLLSSGILDEVLSYLNNIHSAQDFVLDSLTDGRDGAFGGASRKRLLESLNPETCADVPKRLVGKVSHAKDPPDMRITELVNNEVKDGSYQPGDCKSHCRVAIIVPIRGREENLRHMLAHMHPIWQRQELSYTVFTITQAGTRTFNKAKLMNAGFKEARSCTKLRFEWFCIGNSTVIGDSWL